MQQKRGRTIQTEPKGINEVEEDWKQLGMDSETKYQVWRKDVFCDKFPDEETCDSESDE